MHSKAEEIRLGGGERGIERQHRHGRLTARERIDKLVDKGTTQFECGLFIAEGMYLEYGGRSICRVLSQQLPKLVESTA